MIGERIINRLEFVRIEIAIKVGLASICEPIEATIKALQKAELSEFTAAIASILLADINPRDVSVTRQRSGSHIPLVLNQFKDSVVGWRPHPLRMLAHLPLNSEFRTHMHTGMMISSGYLLLSPR